MSEAVESSFVDKGIHYHIQLCVQQSDTFSISLIDDDQPDRWEGYFNGQSINKLTASTGNTKKIQIFYKMLQNAILGNSNEVSFAILSQRDINEMRNGSQSQSQVNDTGSSMIQSNQNESRYFILEQKTEFDRVKYPLRLINKPHTTEELKTMIRALRSENKRLSSFEQSNTHRDQVRNLEQQIYDLNGSIRQLAEEKDQTIEMLKRKISDLEEKARARNAKAQNSTLSRQRNIQNNSSNYNSMSKNSSLYRKKTMVSTIGRGATSSRYQTNRSRFSSASSSAAGSQKSSAASSRKSSAANSRKSSAAGSRKSSAANSRNNSAGSSASNSRPSSRNSNGSYKRFNPTEWVLSHQRSGGGSRNNSRNQSPSGQNNAKNSRSNNRVMTSQNDLHLKRLRNLVQRKYI